MARYIATSGSHFTPMSYEELVKPIERLDEAHAKTQQEADTLAMQAGAIGSMIDDSSPRAKELYDNYMNGVDELVNDLYNNGISPGSVNALSRLRRAYGQDITKINAAITQKGEAVKQYDADMSKDKTLITSRDPRTLSLDNWLDDPYAGKYDSYSGTMLQAKAASVGENMRRDILENQNAWAPILGGQYFERNMFQGFHVKEIQSAIDGILRGEESTNERVKLLQTAMQNVYDSSGMAQWASPEQKARALNYIGDGIYSAVGDFKNNIQQNQDHMTPYQRAQLALSAAKANGAAAGGVVQPRISRLRGNSLDGSDVDKTVREKKQAYDALTMLNELKKQGALFTGKTPNPEAIKLMRSLEKNSYFRELSKGSSRFISNTDLDPILSALNNELEKAVRNDRYYTFENTSDGASLIAKDVLKLNIGQLSGKEGKQRAAAVARYANGDAVSATDLMSLLDAKDTRIGFDAKTGRITIQRVGADSSQDAGKYNDKVVYLDSKSVLSGTVGFVNAGAYLQSIVNAMPGDMPASKQQEIYNKLQALANQGDVIPLANLAQMLKDNYYSMRVDGSEYERYVYDMLVESLALGLYDSSNTPWSPNSYREGWKKEKGYNTLED